MRYFLFLLSMLAAFAQTRPLQPSLMEDAERRIFRRRNLGSTI